MAVPPSSMPRRTADSVKPAPSMPAGTMILASATDGLLAWIGTDACRGDLDGEVAVVRDRVRGLHRDRGAAEVDPVAVVIAEVGDVDDRRGDHVATHVGR